MTTESLPIRLTRAQIALSKVEDDVSDLLAKIGLTLSDWEDWHYDPYDDELVVEGYKPLDDDQRAALMRHGFKPKFVLRQK